MGHSDFLTKFPATGDFTVSTHRVTMAPAQHLPGWSQSTETPVIPQAAAPELLCRAGAPLALPRAPGQPGQSPFPTPEHKLLPGHLPGRSCIFPELCLHSSSGFIHDTGRYFSILTADAVLTEELLLSATPCGNQILIWGGQHLTQNISSQRGDHQWHQVLSRKSGTDFRSLVPGTERFPNTREELLSAQFTFHQSGICRL